jgi:hypothetical protein
MSILRNGKLTDVTKSLVLSHRLVQRKREKVRRVRENESRLHRELLHGAEEVDTDLK